MLKSRFSSDFLILGGTGFVGQSLLNVVERIGMSQPGRGKVYVLSRSKQRTSSHIATSLFGDLTKVETFLPEVDVIIHAATPASATLNVTSPAEMYELNLLAMKNLLEVVRTWKSPPRIIFTSSGAVYGDMPPSLTSFPEGLERRHWTSLQSSAYSDGKRAAEQMLIDATDQGNCVGIIARLFAFSGSHLPRDRHFAIGNFVQDAVSRNQIVVRSDGSSIRSYLDEMDMAEWLLRIAEDGVPNKIYHVGSERAISIRDLAMLVATRYKGLTGNTVTVEILGETSPLDGVTRYVPSTVVTRNDLKLKETVSLETSIDNMLLSALAIK